MTGDQAVRVRWASGGAGRVAASFPTGGAEAPPAPTSPVAVPAGLGFGEGVHLGDLIDTRSAAAAAAKSLGKRRNPHRL